MKPRLGRGGSGKCSPTPGRLWLASENVKRPSPQTLRWVRGPPLLELTRPNCRAPGISGRARLRWVRRRGARSPRAVGPWDRGECWVGSGSYTRQEKVGPAGGAGAGDQPERQTGMRPSVCLVRPFGACEYLWDNARYFRVDWESLSGRVYGYCCLCVILHAVGCEVICTWSCAVIAFYNCVGLSDILRDFYFCSLFCAIIECGCVTGDDLCQYKGTFLVPISSEC